MECKYYRTDMVRKPEKRINRYIMECKCQSASSFLSVLTELIDTLWNVNEEEYFLGREYYQELIDTLWNVNTYVRGIDYLGYRN